MLQPAEQGTQATGALRFDPDKLARIPETDRRWAWVEIDLNAIRHNASAKKRSKSGTRSWAGEGWTATATELRSAPRRR